MNDAGDIFDPSLSVFGLKGAPSFSTIFSFFSHHLFICQYIYCIWILDMIRLQIELNCTR
ncbi:unnamed protein product [Arabidopsis halleri]